MATTNICKVFYDHTTKTKKSHFIIINSIAAYFSFPNATGYIAARWALMGYTKALQADLYRSQITISQVILGKVTTPYFTNNPISEQRIPKIVNWLIPTLTTKNTNVIIQKIITRPKKTVIRPRILNLFVFLNKLTPNLFNYLFRLGN